MTYYKRIATTTTKVDINIKGSVEYIPSILEMCFWTFLAHP